jgi:autotransporter-associated beta strand protein
MSRLPVSRLSQWIAFLTLVLTPPSASAQSTYTWSTTTTNNSWLDPANWLVGGSPTTVFPGTTSNVGLPNGHPLDIAEFGNFDTSLATTGLAIDFTNGTGAQGVMGLGAIHLTAGTGGDLRIGTSSPTTNGELNLNGQTVSSIANVLLANTSGSRNLIIANTPAGSGTQTMSVVMSQPGVFLVTTGGTITVNSQLTQSAPAGFTVRGGGTVVLGATNGFTGSVIVTEASTLSVSQDRNFGQVPGSPAAGKIVLDNATLNVTTGFTLNGNRGIALGPTSGTSSGTFNIASGQTLSYAGAIANNPGGTGALVKTGAGTLALSGGNTFTGAVTISGGVLQINSSSQITPSGTAPVTIDGATLRHMASAGVTFLSNTHSVAIGGNGGTIDIPNAPGIAIYTNGSITGTGNTLTKTGAGTLRMATSTNGVQKLVVTGGLWQSNTDTGFGAVPGAFLADAITLNGGGISTNAGINLSANRGITLGASGGTIDTPSNLLSIGVISGSGGLTKTGANILTLNTAATYTGGTTINAGTIQLATASNRLPTTGNLTFNAGTLNLNALSQTINALSSSGAVGMITSGAAGTPTLTVGNGDGSGTFSGVIQNGSGTVAFTKVGAGTQTLGGANTYTGATTVNGGTLAISGSLAAGSTVTVNNTATLTGTGTVNGATTVNTGGTLIAGNPTAALGADPGTLTVGGNIAFNSGSNFRVRLTGGTPGTNGGSSGGTPTNPANNGYLVQSAGTFTFDSNANIVIDWTGIAFTQHEVYSYRVGQSTAAIGLNITDQSKFKMVDDYPATNFSLTADGTGAIFLTFTPVPEPGTILGIAAGAIGLGGLLRRLRARSPAPVQTR